MRAQGGAFDGSGHLMVWEIWKRQWTTFFCNGFLKVWSFCLTRFENRYEIIYESWFELGKVFTNFFKKNAENQGREPISRNWLSPWFLKIKKSRC